MTPAEQKIFSKMVAHAAAITDLAASLKSDTPGLFPVRATRKGISAKREAEIVARRLNRRIRA